MSYQPCPSRSGLLDHKSTPNADISSRRPPPPPPATSNAPDVIRKTTPSSTDEEFERSLQLQFDLEAAEHDAKRSTAPSHLPFHTKFAGLIDSPLSTKSLINAHPRTLEEEQDEKGLGEEELEWLSAQNDDLRSKQDSEIADLVRETNEFSSHNDRISTIISRPLSKTKKTSASDKNVPFMILRKPIDSSFFGGMQSAPGKLLAYFEQQRSNGKQPSSTESNQELVASQSLNELEGGGRPLQLSAMKDELEAATRTSILPQATSSSHQAVPSLTEFVIDSDYLVTVKGDSAKSSTTPPPVPPKRYISKRPSPIIPPRRNASPIILADKEEAKEQVNLSITPNATAATSTTATTTKTDQVTAITPAPTSTSVASNGWWNQIFGSYDPFDRDGW